MITTIQDIWQDLPILIPELLRQISEVASCLHHFGWAEANAGNLSINITGEIRDHLLLSDDDTTQYFLVSRSGSRYRQMRTEPLNSLVLISVSDKGTNVYPEFGKPTSEWSSHMAVQYEFIRSHPDYRVVLHSHPTELIVLSELTDSHDGWDIHQALYQALPELSFYLPEGIAWCEYRLPGSEELSRITIERIENKKALVWSKHGLLCFGKDPDEALDYMEIVNKAAKVLLLKKD